MRIALCDDNKDWLDTEKEYFDCMNDSCLSYDTFTSVWALIFARYKTTNKKERYKQGAVSIVVNLAGTLNCNPVESLET